ncbi:Modification methylase HpaII [Ephemeroptericola cinctiostellae]|uniref:Modification methylase HpaII n=1 Tax=Ephemeroptericola cinctiostellae TaxID=2268024 RepID=A0A345D7G9_9BURK|nr:Modification methylase HpaII [Ephemeroptericola cinctiostellae]
MMRDGVTLDAVQALGSKSQIHGTLNASMGIKQCLGNQEAFSGNFHVVTAFSEGGFAQFNQTPVAGSLRASGGANGQGSENLVMDVVAIQGNIIDRAPEHGGNGIGAGFNVAPTLTRNDRHAVAFQSNAGSKINMAICNELVPTLTRNASHMAVFNRFDVRRLTPVECERLQGFADDYTLVTYRGALAKDTPRYTALGNSMAVPVMAWIGQRIDQYLGVNNG